MSRLVLQLPCGNRQSIESSVAFGRGNPSSLTDGIMSRQQVQLVPVEGLAGQVLQLTNLGLNPVIVEHKHPTEVPAGATAAGVASSNTSSWQFSDLLERGDSTCVGPNTRFYLAARQDTTMFTLGLAEQWNSGCLGAHLSDIVKGPLQLAVVCNYMIDLEWLLATCPDLKLADK
eukprot:gene4594-4848_t